MVTRRTHVVLAHDLVVEIDRIVGKRHRSEFLAEAAARELLRQRQLHALEDAAGAWKRADHPELQRGGALFVRRIRAENDRRLRRLRGRT